MILGVSAVFVLAYYAVSTIFCSYSFIAVSQNRRTFAPGIQNRYGLGFGGFCV